ncbi:hypothetical protein ACR77J_07765 [Tissierella praeacuta]|uniref:hypothetical protein n=1 Tax=Tissierella praeacuta TaxID=43131 RepID=UPI003DA32404
MIINENQLIKYCKNNNVELKIPMTKLNSIFGICYKASSDKVKNVWCRIIPKEIYKDSYYKVYVVANDNQYGCDEYYLQSLVSLINSGHIKIKIRQ